MTRKRVGIAVAAGAATVIALIPACRDITAPRQRPQNAEPLARNCDAPAAPSAILTPNHYSGGGSTADGALLASFPEQPTVYVIANGYVVRHDNTGIGGDVNYGAGQAVAIIERFP